MGFSFCTVALSIDRLVEVCGSKDERFLAAMVKAQKRAIADADDERDDDAPALREVLADLVMGTVRYKKSGHRYAQAFEVLCQHLGKRVDDDDLNPSWVAEHLDDLLGGDIMKILRFYAKRLVTLPKWDGMPEVAMLEAKHCVALGPKFADALNRVGRRDKEQKRALTELGNWLKAGEKAGLVIFIR